VILGLRCLQFQSRGKRIAIFCKKQQTALTFSLDFSKMTATIIQASKRPVVGGQAGQRDAFRPWFLQSLIFQAPFLSGAGLFIFLGVTARG
jgi:hypothetical protein